MTLRPAYRIRIGDHVVDTTEEPKASTVVDLSVRLDMDSPVDGFTVVQGQVGGLRAEPGDEASIDLGYADEDNGLVRVLTGLVVAVEAGVERRRIAGHSSADKLLRTFVDKTYEDVTAGDVVRSLAGEAGLDVDTVDPGPTLPAYVVDGRRNAARHIRDLAYLAGVDTYLTADGALVFRSFTGGRAVHVITYGEHVLDCELARTRPRAGTVLTWGESPGSARGEESWAWLTKDFTPRRGSAGTSAPTLVVERAVLRTALAAGATASAVAQVLEERTVEGRVLIQGRPQLALGDLLRLEGFPSTAGLDAVDGNYQVRGLHHRLTKSHGLVTWAAFRSIAGAAQAAAGGAL